MNNKTLKLIYYRDPKDLNNYCIYLTNDTGINLTKVTVESVDSFNSGEESHLTNIVKEELGQLDSKQSLLVEKEHYTGLDFLTFYKLDIHYNETQTATLSASFKYSAGRDVKISGKKVTGQLIEEIKL